jgi:hypothetical protein
MKQQLNDFQLKEMQLTSLKEGEEKNISGGWGFGKLFSRLAKMYRNSGSTSQASGAGYQEGPPTTDPGR